MNKIDHPNIVKIKECGNDGFVVSPRDPSSLANAMEKIFSLDNKNYQKMCLSSKSLVNERFSSDKIYEIIKRKLYKI